MKGSRLRSSDSSLPVTFSRIVPALDAEIAPQELDDRQIRSRLAVGDRGALDDQAALHAVRVCEFVVEAGLPDAGFADDGDDLASPRLRMLDGLRELLHLGR